LSIPRVASPLTLTNNGLDFHYYGFCRIPSQIRGKGVVLVGVDRLTKYSHFVALSHPYTAHTVAQLFVDHIFRLHGLPAAILTDRGQIFTSQLWQSIFKGLKVSLQYSSAYHPQTDDQTERVNQCLENYLRCMAFLEPKKWISWLPLAEWWYNTNYHTSLKSTPFEALCGFKPPMMLEVLVPSLDSSTTEFLTQHMMTKLRENLIQAQERMKIFVDSKRTEREFMVGDMVYLKLQPFKHHALDIH
jgi:hypothetical protein